jgi:hypothetical protein
MSNNSWWQTLTTAQVAGSAVTAASATSHLPPAARFTFPASLLKIGDMFRITASGIISCVVTTPGTARFDIRVGSAVVFDTQAMNLNVVAQTNVPWWLDLHLVCRSIGNSTNATLLGQGTFTSPAVVGSPTSATGGNGVFAVPVSGGVVVGSGFDSTVSNVFDSFFTQTVATGSMTTQTYTLAYCT